MAMTIRFDDEENELLRAQAEAEGVSMAELVKRSVREHITRMSVLNRLMDAWGPLPQDQLDRAAASLCIDRRSAAALGPDAQRAAS
ncbi:DUF6290 family protein [Sphaerimonospora cavernae]|uniref:DUF6290 family protein n=1 Tax=Sphaerimonospora cavernae TaxID=1740611 RepID=A0ABV6U552_9ACTN